MRRDGHRSAVAEPIDPLGSTAVPHLAAKATLDVQGSVATLHDEGRYRRLLYWAGLQLGSRDAEHRLMGHTDAKSDLILGVLERAEGWARACRWAVAPSARTFPAGPGPAG